MSRIVNIFDAIAKIGAGAAVLFLLVSIVFPPAPKLLKAGLAWRFGVVGAVKYHLGTESNDVEYPERKPTRYGQLYLLSTRKAGEREYSDLKIGDILQAKGDKHLRLLSGCNKTKSCGSAPRLLTLAVGECVVVLSKLYPDNEGSDSDLLKLQGGWLKVSTTSCGIFN